MSSVARSTLIRLAADGGGLFFGLLSGVITARWLEQTAAEGRFFKLDTSTVSVLGYEREHPALLSWNS